MEQTVQSMKQNNYVACLKWGNKYHSDYVNKLNSMVRKHCTVDYEFICFTENKQGLDKDITVLPLPKLRTQGWWFKPMFLGSELGIQGTLLFLDLDVIVFNNINKLFKYSPGSFLICRDFNRSIRHNWDRMNSSVFRVPIGRYDKLYQKFKNSLHTDTTKYRGDQDWMFANIRDHTFWPDDWIQSYKWEMRDRRELQIDTHTRKRNFAVDNPPNIKKDTCIAVFHGEPNPADAKDSWVKQHWG